MVELKPTPWTQKGRMIAIEKAVAGIYDRYFLKGPRWIAKHLPERKDMGRYKGKVSDETREMLIGNFGVESFIEDYALYAIGSSGGGIASRQTYTQWVFDENRHSQALYYCLVDSDLFPREKVDDYLYECSQDNWTFEKQTGHEPTPARGAAYAIAQERQTKRNYQSLQKRIWGEYGEPTDGQGRSVYPAIAGVCRTLSVDEGFHEGVFRQITLAHLQYWPDIALQAMWDVYEKYRMPLVKLPNAEAFLHAVLSTGVDSAREVVRNVLDPTYQAMGLENRVAVKKAARASWDLPEGAVIQVGDKPDPEWTDGVIPYRMEPNGTLAPLEAVAA